MNAKTRGGKHTPQSFNYFVYPNAKMEYFFIAFFHYFFGGAVNHSSHFESNRF